MAYNVGPLMASNNLSDVNNVPEARFNISLGSALSYPTVSEMGSIFVPAGTETLVLDGYFHPADGGGAPYIKVGTEPSTPGKFQTADGAWWSLSTPIVTPLMFGAKGDGTTDDYQAITDCFTYLAAFAYPGNVFSSYLWCNGNGKVYATSQPLSVPSNVTLYNFTFIALSGASWSGNPSKTFKGYGTNGILVISNTSSAYNICLNNITLDCNFVANCQALYCAAADNINFTNIQARNWADTGNGVILDGGATVYWVGGQIFGNLSAPNFGDQTKAYGMAIGLFDCWDSTFMGISMGQALIPLYCGPRSSMNRFIDCHPWQSAPSVPTPWVNPYGIYYEGFRSIFDTTYMDSCPFFHNVTTLINADGYPVPQVTITNTISIYAPTASTFSEWYKMSTSVADTPLDKVIIDGNYWDPAADPWAFEETGAGSYAMGSLFLSRLNAARYDSQFLASRSASWVFQGNTDFLGSEVRGNRISINVNHSTAYTLSDYDAGELLNLDAGSAVTITAPSDVSAGFQCEIYLSGAGGTLTPASGCVINGSGSAVTLSQNKLYKLTCFYSSGGSALYGLLGV